MAAIPPSQPPTADHEGPGAAGPLRMRDVTAAVLAGGRSSRFGSDKARAPVGGRPMLERVLDSLAAAAQRWVVRVEGVGEPPPLPADVTLLHDRLPGGGPLSGLHAALTASPTPWLALAACDLPCLTPAFWELLASHADTMPAVAVVQEDGRLEPLAALYHRSLLPEVERRLRARDLRIQPLLLDVGASLVDAREVTRRCGATVLRNVNRPGDVPDPEHPCEERPGSGDEDARAGDDRAHPGDAEARPSDDRAHPGDAEAPTSDARPAASGRGAGR